MAAARGDIVKGPTTISYWLLAILAAGPLAAQPVSTQPAASIVSEIRVTGNQRSSVNSVLASVKMRSGHVYDEAGLRADEQRLLDTGNYSTVTVRKTQTPQGLDITFEVVERPAITKLEIVGNKSLSTDELMKDLLQVGGERETEIGRRDVTQFQFQALGAGANHAVAAGAL